jgi:four helix bundle protein
VLAVLARTTRCARLRAAPGEAVTSLRLAACGCGPATETAGRKKSLMKNRFTFRLYGVSLDTIRIVNALVTQIAKHDPDLARQARRALTSMHLNIAESIDAQGGNRRLRMRTALGSTNETLACLDAAAALGYIELDPHADALLTQVRATLLKCVMPK